jgi:hypothetical protein
MADLGQGGYLKLKNDLLQELQAKKAQLEEKARRAAKQRAWDWMADPVSWVADIVRFPEPPKAYRIRKQGLAPYQGGAMRQAASQGRLLMYGPHGLGKSTTMALLVWWFATTRELAGIDWKIITTASSWKQLNDFLWPEVHKWAKFINWERLGIAEPQLGQDLLGLALKWPWGAASAAASTDPAKMEGAHATHLMYVLDEAKAIGPGTWDAIEGAFSTEDLDGFQANDGDPENQGGEDERPQIKNIIAVAMSTPGPATGRFYQIATGKPGYEDWTVRKVDKQEVLDAGRMSAKWAEQRRKQWGEGSSVYQMRVLGEFFLDDPDALIPLSWVEAAQARWQDWKAAGRPALEGARWLGIDVAGGGADHTVMARRTGWHITRLEYPRDTDLMKIAREISRVRDYRYVIDTLGVGQGVTSRLKQLWEEKKVAHRPIAFVGAASTKLTNLTREYGFTNSRSAAWWMVREALDPQNETGAMLPPDEELVADLTAPTWSINQTGKPPLIKVEPKADVKLKLGRSPDFGDAVAMAYWAGAARRPVGVAKAAAQGGPIKGTTTLGPVAQSVRNRARVAQGRGKTAATGLSPLGSGRTAARTKGGL